MSFGQTIFAAIRWYVVVSALAWLVFPLVFRLLRGLPDRGLGLVRLLGIWLAILPAWWLAGWGFLPFRDIVILTLVLIFGVLLWFWQLRSGEILPFFRAQWRPLLVYELATGRFIAQREDALFLGPPGTGKSHLAQAIGHAAIQQGYRVLYREAHTLLEELTDATLAGTRKAYLAELTTVPLLIIDDLGMRKLPHTAAEDLLEVVMRRYERASTLLTSNRPVEDWGKLLGDTAAVTALLDRMLHHAHILKCGPRSWRTKLHTDLRPA